LAETGRDLDRATRQVFRRLTSRSPSGAETGVLRRMVLEQRGRFAERPADAAALMKVGRSAPGSEDPLTAAMTVAVIAMLSHDECVMKR